MFARHHLAAIVAGSALLPATSATAAGGSAGIKPAGRAAHAAFAQTHRGNIARRGGAHHRGAHESSARKVEGDLRYEWTPAGAGLPATRTITLFLPGGVQSAGAKLPSCKPAELERIGSPACPRRSLIGNGSATGWTLGQLWPMTLTLYNGPGGELLTYITASSPVKIETIAFGKISHPAGGTYGEEIVTPVPEGLLEPLPGDIAQTVNLRVHINGASGWLTSTNCAPRALAVNFVFSYTNGQTLSVGGNLRCI